MPSINQRIGEYVLEGKIAAGTFGEVWRAHHHVWTDQLVAVKIPTDPQYLRNLQREGCAIHGLVHPNIVRAISFDPYAETPYLTTEFVPGTSLRPLIQKRSLSLSDSAAIMRQVLAGLGHAHSRGIIHRDIKPENILVHERAFVDGFASEGVIKVTDFGLGKAATAGIGSIAYSASLNDAAGREIAGSLDYMAPEQRSGAAIDARADLYACGVVLCELLTGEKPAGTEVPSDLNKSVPKVLDDAFRRSYARLDKRFASSDEFSKALGVVPPPMPKNVRVQRPSINPLISTIACPRCKKPVDSLDQFCMYCGVQMMTTVRRCRKCGAYPDGKDQFCIFCGENVAPELTLA
jgi:serine/threonine protein kinase